MTSDSYVREIKSIDEEIKRVNAHLKRLREQKNQAKSRLYTYMKKSNTVKCQNISIKSVAPRVKKVRVPKKTEAQKRKDAILFFEKVGVPDPKDFYEEFAQTQMIKTQ